MQLAEPIGAQVRALALCESPLWVADAEGVVPGVLGRQQIEMVVAEYERALNALAVRHRSDRVDVQTEVLRRAPPADAILELAETIGPALLVIGTSGRSAWHRFIVGSTASRIVAEANRPVVAVTLS